MIGTRRTGSMFINDPMLREVISFIANKEEIN